MMREAIIPDVITFLVLLTACSHAGLVAEGEKYYNEMNIIYSLTPVLEHHACMVDLWGSAGQLDKAILFIENVSGPNKLRPLSILMGACQKWLNVGLGRWAFEHLLELDGNNVALYVSMSNMYVSF
jgi:pentatricopeptide repeat protein